MRYYPINLDIRNRNCLVVGGGAVGARKTKTLLDCSAKVFVVSPRISQSLRDLARHNAVTLKNRAYRPDDLEGMFLVIGATDDEALNQQVSRDAEKMGKLCNIADQPQRCNFILPSIVNQGDLTVAISTSGQSPAFAKMLRKDLEKTFGKEYAQCLQLMGAIRRKLLSTAHAPEAHKPQFEALLAGGILAMIRKRDMSAINALLQDILGNGYVFEELMQTKTDQPQDQ